MYYKSLISIKPLLVVLVILKLNLGFSQDSIKRKKITFLPVPALGYSPETRTYVGAVLLCNFDLDLDSTTRSSNAKFEFNYTWNKQVIFETTWNYFTKEEKWFTKGSVNISKFPDLYYGIGARTPDSNRSTFTSNRNIFDVSVLRKIRPAIFVGIQLRFYDYSRFNTSFVQFPELKTNQTVGVGYVVINDKRNNILTPTKGHYLNLTHNLNFSSAVYRKLSTDIRMYFTWKKNTLSIRHYNEFTNGIPPFYDYALLGGDKYVRAFYLGRFRDKNLSTIQTEIRRPLFWRFGCSIFGGYSFLYPNLKILSLNNSKYNAGIGLRFLVDKKDGTHLRIDYAIGQGGNSGFYISFGESF